MTSGLTATASPIALIGDGVAAGYVLSYPAGLPVPFASVSLCPPNLPYCPYSSTANGAGYYWVAGPPGLDVLSASAPGYASNTSALVDVPSDGWVSVGPVAVIEFAVVTGKVVALPSGVPLAGANVSLCPSSVLQGNPYCYAATSTGSDGTFQLGVAPGLYVLQANATHYNATFLWLSLSPGEVVDLGLIGLELFGSATGTILGSDTQSPIPEAQAVACPAWSTGNCTMPAIADPATGTYLLSGPAGPYTLIASAPGYFPGSVRVSLVSGGLVLVPTIFLEAVGSATHFLISGTVLAPGPPAGTCRSRVRCSPTSRGRDDERPERLLRVHGGAGLVHVDGRSSRTGGGPRAAPGERGRDGIRVVLAPMMYAWNGTVSDGLDGRPFPNATVSVDGLEAARTTPNGSYSLSLANGTYGVTVEVAGGPAIYAPGNFTLTVNGAPGRRNVPIFPPTGTIYVLVVDGVTGVAVPDARVVVSGTVSPEGIATRQTLGANALGEAQVTVFTGSYDVTASATGYLNRSQALQVTGSGVAPLTVSITTPGEVQSGPPSTSWEMGVLLGGGIIAAAAVAYALTRRLAPARWDGPSPHAPVR